MLFMLMRGWRRLTRRLRGLRDWWYRNRPPPFIDVGTVSPLGGEAGEHRITFVSRHHIAECGLACVNCRQEAARRGDFREVRETVLGEAVICSACGYTLVASPDTEHGDLIRLQEEERLRGKEAARRLELTMTRFVRISQIAAVRETYGDDMGISDAGDLTANRQRLRAGGDRKTDDEVLARGIPWAEAVGGNALAPHPDIVPPAPPTTPAEQA